MSNTISEPDVLSAVVRNFNERFAGRATTGTSSFEQTQVLATRAKKWLENFFDLLYAQLDGRSFAVSERFTLAEISASVTLVAADAVELRPGDNHTNIKHWTAILSERTSMQV